METTNDQFLGGKVTLRQPKTGYRAAIDPVFLAAAVAAKPGQKVLELGCGAGAAMLCLAARVPGLSITGIEIQEEYYALALENTANHSDIATFHVKPGDVRRLPRDIPANCFDHVMANPPYHDAKAYDPGSNKRKSVAHAMGVDDLEAWVKSAHRHLKHRGLLTMIYGAASLPDLLAAMAGRFGGITVLPLWPKQGVAAKRVLVRGAKASKAPFTLLGGMVLHQKNGIYTAETQRTLSKENQALTLSRA